MEDTRRVYSIEQRRISWPAPPPAAEIRGLCGLGYSVKLAGG